MVLPCPELHLVVVPPLADDPRHLVHRHRILHRIQVSRNYCPVDNVGVIDIREVQSVFLLACLRWVEVDVRFQESQIDLDGWFRPFRLRLPFQDFCGVYDGDGDGDGDVFRRAPRFLLSTVFVEFRLLQAIDFYVDDALHVSPETDFFLVIFHSSELLETTLLYAGICLASTCAELSIFREDKIGVDRNALRFC